MDLTVERFSAPGGLKLERLREVLRAPAAELSVFERGTTWKSDDSNAKKAVEYLEPHSLPYFSVLRPLFLAQVRSAGLIDSLSPVLSRDGALSLAIFFRAHPAPMSPDALLLVHERLAFLVPGAWTDSVAYYRVEPRREGTAGKPGKAYVILTSIDGRQISLRGLRRRLEVLRSALPKGTPVEVMSCLNIYFDQTPEGFDRRGHFFFDAVSEMRAVFGEDLRYARWSESLDRVPSGSVFLDLNESDFYYADSALVHAFLRQGARPFGSPETSEIGSVAESISIPASIHHSFRIFPERSAEATRRSAEFWGGWRRLAGSRLIQEEEEQFRALSKDLLKKGFKFCSKSFEDFVYGFVSPKEEER